MLSFCHQSPVLQLQAQCACKSESQEGALHLTMRMQCSYTYEAPTRRGSNVSNHQGVALYQQPKCYMSVLSIFPSTRLTRLIEHGPFSDLLSYHAGTGGPTSTTAMLKGCMREGCHTSQRVSSDYFQSHMTAGRAQAPSQSQALRLKFT